MVNDPLIRPYFLGVGISLGALRFPLNIHQGNLEFCLHRWPIGKQMEPGHLPDTTWGDDLAVAKVERKAVASSLRRICKGTQENANPRKK